jgi:hypothetical protein
MDLPGGRAQFKTGVAQRNELNKKRLTLVTTTIRDPPRKQACDVSNMGQMNHVHFCPNKKIMSSNVIQKWVESYLRAALEADGQKMPERIVTARHAIAGRLRDLEGNSDHHAERHEMQLALAALTGIEDEMIIWPTAATTHKTKTS